MKPAGISWRQHQRLECCARKVRHATWEDARLAGLAVWLENPQPQYANPATPYVCGVSGSEHYHCGHMTVNKKHWRGAA